MELRGRSVVVTGASSGIGAAAARALAREGATVHLLARNAAKLEETVACIEIDGGRGHAWVVDCTDHAAVGEAAARIEADHGVPDVIVNNAGAGRFLFLEETDPAEMESMMGAPYFAAAHVTRAFLPGMIERNHGQVIAVNSPIALVAWKGAVGYAGARWALRGFCEALRSDLRGTRIAVSHVVFGKVQSGYFEHNPGAEEGIPRIAGIVRTLTPEECADTIVRTIERPRREVITPPSLRLLVAQSKLLPRPTEFLMHRTGKRRPTQPRKETHGTAH